MTIELANRLVEFRKKFGYSQEQLANQLNVSRQSISNWESGEVTPSIDYLKELAKIYGVTMDELVSGDKIVEEVLNKKEDKEATTNNDTKTSDSEKDTTSTKGENTQTGDQVHIGKDGIHVNSKNGDKVDIDTTGIHVNDQNVFEGPFTTNGDINIKVGPSKKRRKIVKEISSIMYGVTSLLIVTAYLLLGFLAPNGWAVYWTLFLLIPVPSGIIEAIAYKKFGKFPIVFIVCFVYLFFGMYMGLWNPYWVEFLAIPIYYAIFEPIDKIIFEHNLQKGRDDSVITVNGKDIKVHDNAATEIDDMRKDIEDTQNEIAVLKKRIEEIKGLDKDTIKDLKDDFMDEIEDVSDEIDDINDDIDDLEDEADFPLDIKIEYRTKLSRMKTDIKNLKEDFNNIAK